MDRTHIEKISKALGDSTRLRIFEAISASSSRLSCSDIIAARRVTPATVSHHLKILTEAGLIICERQGQFVYCEAVPQRLAEYARALDKMANGRFAAR